MANLIAAAGKDQLKRSDIELDIQQCLIDPCGGCSEAGIIFVLLTGWFFNRINVLSEKFNLFMIQNQRTGRRS